MPSISPFTGNLSRQQVVHLLHRTNIAYTHAEVEALIGLSPAAAVDLIYNQTAPEPSPPVDPNTNLTFHEREEITDGLNPAFTRLYTRSWYLKEMIETTESAKEKMTLFMHTHFTNDQVKTSYAFPLYHQNALFRRYALGNFKELSKKVCRDYAMSIFLDGWTNSAQEPNENFAREFLELYTIGKGEQIGIGNYTTYTEDDVREAARVLTGFIPIGFVPDGTVAGAPPIEFDPATGLYRSSIWPALHDPGTKTFSSAFQSTTINTGTNDVAGIEAELDSFIDMIFSQQATALHICTKLYRFFCYYEISPEIETDIIQELANTFIASNFELLPVLKQLFNSQHFYDQDDAILENNNIGSLVKSPIELLAGSYKFFNVAIGDSSDLVSHYTVLTYLDAFMTNMDMTLFQTPEVAGYPAYHQAPFYNRNWLSATSLVNRYAIFEYLTFGFPINNGAFTLQLDTVDFCENSGIFVSPGDINELVDTLCDNLFPFGVEAAKRVALKNFLLDGGPDFYWTLAWDEYISSGDDTVVRFRLNNLYNAILQSAEFQLS